MNVALRKGLVLSRKIYRKAPGLRETQFIYADNSSCVIIEQQASDRIKDLLSSDGPCMISRLGRNEAEVLVRYLGMTKDEPLLAKSLDYIRGRTGPFWWDEDIMERICNGAGFFPPSEEPLSRFSQEMLNDLSEIDILGSWLKAEDLLAGYMPHALRVPLVDLDPMRHSNPWSESLEGKNVLVVSPFDESIKLQYAKRKLLFENQKVLPGFNLKTLRSVQSIAGNLVPFPSWFDALQHMKEGVGAIDFDIALVGAGAYGLPLSAHIKRMGKKAVHLGGSTQILFGIRGKRWEGCPNIAR